MVVQPRDEACLVLDESALDGQNGDGLHNRSCALWTSARRSSMMISISSALMPTMASPRSSESSGDDLGIVVVRRGLHDGLRAWPGRPT